MSQGRTAVSCNSDVSRPPFPSHPRPQPWAVRPSYQIVDSCARDLGPRTLILDRTWRINTLEHIRRVREKRKQKSRYFTPIIVITTLLIYNSVFLSCEITIRGNNNNNNKHHPSGLSPLTCVSYLW